MIIFEPWRENYHFSQPSYIFLIYTATLYTYSVFTPPWKQEYAVLVELFKLKARFDLQPGPHVEKNQ